MRAPLLSRALVLAVALAAAPSFAAPPKPAPKPAAPAAKPGAKGDVGPALTKLKSSDENQIRAGLDDLRLLGPAGAAGAGEVSNLLNKGLNDVLTIQAIDTLGDIESP